MPKEITIGADELILWLRKNEKAKNDTTVRLGIKILDLIENQLGGKKIADDYPSCWEIGDKNVNQFNLPKTSAQYKIGTEKMGRLYEIICDWE